MDPAAFAQVPDSPFAYWVSEALQQKFRDLPPFESEGLEVKVGLQTSDDFRFVRAWWEVDPARIVHVPVKAEDLDDPARLTAYQEECREQTQSSTHWASGASHPLCTPEVRRWIESLDMVPIAMTTYCRWYGDPADRVRDAQSARLWVILGAQRFPGGGEPMSRSLRPGAGSVGCRSSKAGRIRRTMRMCT